MEASGSTMILHTIVSITCTTYKAPHPSILSRMTQELKRLLLIEALCNTQQRSCKCYQSKGCNCAGWQPVWTNTVKLLTPSLNMGRSFDQIILHWCLPCWRWCTEVWRCNIKVHFMWWINDTLWRHHSKWSVPSKVCLATCLFLNGETMASQESNTWTDRGLLAAVNVLTIHLTRARHAIYSSILQAWSGVFNYGVCLPLRPDRLLKTTKSRLATLRRSYTAYIRVYKCYVWTVVW